MKMIEFLDIRVILKVESSIIEKVWGAKMPRERFKTLTEQMFYILVCLYQECRGADILEKVRTITANRVSIGSGTLYDLLEQFESEGMIRETKSEGRRRSYIITEKGKEMLEREYQRIRFQAADYEHLIRKEDSSCVT